MSAVSISLVLVLTACGQTGELRLPDAATKPPTKAAPNVEKSAPTTDSESTNDGAVPVNKTSETEVN
ncbi:MAG: hypothetical protein K6L81_07425 [Agarilytica sp.]